jgi:hypothetical protein
VKTKFVFGGDIDQCQLAKDAQACTVRTGGLMLARFVNDPLLKKKKKKEKRKKREG